MVMITPPDPYRSSSYSSSRSSVSTPVSTKTKVTLGVVVAWTIVVAAILPAFSIGEIFVGVITPVIGLVVGCFTGFSVGFGVIAHIFSGLFLAPPVMAGILGALAGGVTAWFRATYLVKNKLGRSFVSSLFSAEIFEGNLPNFVCKIMVSTIIGCGVAAALSSIGVFGASAPDLATLSAVVLGGGPPGGSDPISWIYALFTLLGALLVIGAIVGGCTGGIVGAVIGAAFSSIGVATVVQGAAEGAAFRFFADFRPADLKSGRFVYLLAGAAIGISEGIAVGAGTGAILFLVRLAGNIT